VFQYKSVFALLRRTILRREKKRGKGIIRTHTYTRALVVVFTPMDDTGRGKSRRGAGVTREMCSCAAPSLLSTSVRRERRHLTSPPRLERAYKTRYRSTTPSLLLFFYICDCRSVLLTVPFTPADMGASSLLHLSLHPTHFSFFSFSYQKKDKARLAWRFGEECSERAYSIVYFWNCLIDPSLSL
jgi:hypothetical protein